MKSSIHRRIDAPGVRPYAVDPEQAACLWTLSAQLTGTNTFAHR
ncbi:hypothetical protein ACIA6C_14340 [Streptomyces sp. NPDC051578]